MNGEYNLTIERVLIVRHGQTDWNVQGRWQGFEPVPLNTEGQMQARKLAESLRGRPIHTIITSDLPRAFQTAAAIGTVIGVMPRTDQRLREFNLGIFQGHTRDEMIAKFPDEWRAFEADYWDYLIPNGKSRRAMQERVYKAWESALLTAVGPEVVIVSHGGAIRMLLLKLFADIAADLDAAHLNNTSVTTIDKDDYRWRLTEVASVQHLASEGVESTTDTL